MDVVQFLIRTYGVHVCIYSVARLYVGVRQCQAFPLCQRMYHLCPLVAEVLDGEGNGAFCAVQVVVDTHSAAHEKRSCDAAQVQACSEVVLEEILDKFNTLFCLVATQKRTIVLWNNQLTHNKKLCLRAQKYT